MAAEYAAMPAWYQLRVSEVLDERWSNWFDGMVITHDAGGTTLEGHIVDQTALYGLIGKARDLGLTLRSARKRVRIAMNRSNCSNMMKCPLSAKWMCCPARQFVSNTARPMMPGRASSRA